MRHTAWEELSDAVRHVAFDAGTRGDIEVVFSCKDRGDKHRLRDRFMHEVSQLSAVVGDPDMPRIFSVNGVTLKFEDAG